MTPSPGEIRAVAFDFDGVILESADIKTRAFAELFAGYPEHVDAIVQLHLDNAGISRFDKFAWIYRDMLGVPMPEGEMERLDEAFSALVLDQLMSCDFVPGALECLEQFAGHGRLFVASGTPERELQDIVKRRGLGRFFTAVYGSPASKAEILAKILRDEGLLPAELLFVGDALSDYEGAREAGVPFIGRVPAGAEDPFQTDGVLARVEDLEELRVRWDNLFHPVPIPRN